MCFCAAESVVEDIEGVGHLFQSVHVTHTKWGGVTPARLIVFAHVMIISSQPQKQEKVMIRGVFGHILASKVYFYMLARSWPENFWEIWRLKT
jgi:hypothetical protein